MTHERSRRFFLIFRIVPLYYAEETKEETSLMRVVQTTQDGKRLSLVGKRFEETCRLGERKAWFAVYLMSATARNALFTLRFSLAESVPIWWRRRRESTALS